MKASFVSEGEPKNRGLFGRFSRIPSARHPHPDIGERVCFGGEGGCGGRVT